MLSDGEGKGTPSEPTGPFMSKAFTCQCGVVLRGETDDELVANAQRHAREVHYMELTREQVLAMARTE
jgi:predicted small metal-binding protein